MRLKDSTYDLLKAISINVIPSIETFWLTVAGAWKLPYTVEIGITIGAIGMLIAGCIGLSKKAYEKEKAEQYEGVEFSDVEEESPHDD